MNDEKQGAITLNQSSLTRDNDSFSLIAKKKVNLTLIIVGIHVYTLADDEIIVRKAKQLLKTNKILRKIILLGPMLQW